MLDNLYYKFESYFLANPRNVYLLVAVVLAIFGVFSILGKRWAFDPGTYKQKTWYNFLGEKWFSRIIGAIFLIGALAMLSLYFLSK